MATIPSIIPPRRYERGGVSWVTLLLLVVLVGGTYLTIVWAPIFVVHYEVKQTVRDFMNQAVKNKDDAALVQALCAKLKSLDTVKTVAEDGTVERVPAVQVAPEDVTWERDLEASPPEVRVSFEYTREVRYPYLSEEPKEWIGTINLSSDLTVPDWGPSR
jgi:hypothetical protein